MKSQESEWVNLLEEVLERLSTKNLAISYDFNDVVFEAKRVKSKTKFLPRGTVTLNGKITISAGKS